MDDRAEATLVRRAQAGDTGAFDELVGAHAAVVYNVVLRMVGNREDARDLTQQIFLKVWRSIERVDPERRFFCWLYRIALNEASNLRRGRRPETELNDGIVDPAPSPEDCAEQAERDRLVQAALLDLKDEERRLLVIRYYGQLSYEELSGLFGMTEEKLKSRLFMARQKLGRALRRRGYTGP